MRNRSVLKKSKEVAVMTLENAQRKIAIGAQSVLNWLLKKKKKEKENNFPCEFIMMSVFNSLK